MSYASLGQYFAPPAQRARIDLGPEIPGLTPSIDYESRHQFEKGLNAMLAMSRRPRALQEPVSPTTTPALREYQEAMQWLSLRDPSRAAELAHTAGQVGVMAQRRQASTVLFKRPPGPIPGLGPVGGPALGATGALDYVRTAATVLGVAVAAWWLVRRLVGTSYYAQEAPGRLGATEYFDSLEDARAWARGRPSPVRIYRLPSKRAEFHGYGEHIETT